MISHRLALLLACLLPACASVDSESETAPTGWSPLTDAQIAVAKKSPDFVQHIAPILSNKCLACHRGSNPPLGFSMENRQKAMSVGITGARIIPGNPEQSRLIHLTTAHKNARVMPVVGNRLTKDEFLILTEWIRQGAAWPGGKAGELRLPKDAVAASVNFPVEN